ncbi:amidase family protein [Sphingomonas colocasiae]|uniref:Amidase n=1 Tax=Sphingomonas colocasiae TaxID=1848973 RepID=A0ABS7PYB2_9SPHN|nr:amidase family protein [Sphingomonas colocasiae]MBY8826328.1 amidase [Sphingomonas colocasiae]
MPPRTTPVSTTDALAIGRLDAHGQAALVASGDVSPAELVEAALIRMDLLDPALNLITHRDDDRARALAASAAGPMRGVPWLLKDGLDYPGMPNRSGSRSKRDAGSGTIVFDFARAFDAQGLVPMGKTNVPEFGLLPTTEPLLYGPAANPWAPDRSPGGSSGGAAAAVASGMVPLAHAADGGGSIRIPASCCGLVGLKPGRHANLRARDPHVIEDLLVGDVLLSRSVRDVAWAAAIGAGRAQRVEKPGARRLRIAAIADNLDGNPPSAPVARIFDQAASLCASLGHEVTAERLPVDGPAVARAFQTIWGYLARDAVATTIARIGADAAADQLEPWTLNLAKWSDGLSAADDDALFCQVGIASAAMDAFLERYDVILSPVLRHPALRIGELAPTVAFETMWERMFDYVSYTPLHNLTGHPAISLPLFADTDGVPIGSMFAAARGGEDLLLALAFELEASAPWADRWPVRSIAGA